MTEAQDIADLEALARRCEEATGRPRNTRRPIEDAKLDCEIWLAVNGLGDGRRFRKFIRHRKPGVTEYGAWAARTDRGDVSVYASPSYTYSLDSAMSLVPEGWLLQRLAQVELVLRAAGGPWVAQLKKPSDDLRALWANCDGAATPALALTAASLRARAHLTGERK